MNQMRSHLATQTPLQFKEISTDLSLSNRDRRLLSLLLLAVD